MSTGEETESGVRAAWALSFPSKFFVVLLEIANVIYRTTSYKKKARIVLGIRSATGRRITFSTFTEDAEQPEEEA